MIDKKFDKIYCQGVKGAYSHIACKTIFGEKEPHFVRTFEDVCKNAVNGGAGILPSENSTAGIVNGIIELLLKYRLSIIYAKTIAINHNLCAPEGTKIEDITKIYSHQQALLQCSAYLNTLKAEQIETINTAASAIMAANTESAAAVCSKEAAEIYKLNVLKYDICNNNINSTRFIVVSKDYNVSAAANVTSLYFKLKNKSGALYNILKIFADYRVNLSSLHSLPLAEESWHYGFFVDIEGNALNDNINSCINAVKEETEYLHILGSYLSE